MYTSTYTQLEGETTNLNFSMTDLDYITETAVSFERPFTANTNLIALL